ncbi:MAG TPA: hypothetical protein VFZ61_02530, partial [Polyangiales bacterium]
MQSALRFTAWMLGSIAVGCGGDSEPEYTPLDASQGPVVGALPDASPPVAQPPAPGNGNGGANPPTGTINPGLMLDAGTPGPTQPIGDAGADAGPALGDAGPAVGDSGVS